MAGDRTFCSVIHREFLCGLGGLVSKAGVGSARHGWGCALTVGVSGRPIAVHSVPCCVQPEGRSPRPASVCADHSARFYQSVLLQCSLLPLLLCCQTAKIDRKVHCLFI